uniref:Uncharacterized protein n=1 Tax=Siphoviridae sp. ctgmM3 TaxID=2827912 RepID=A0A8S5TJY5_9CAUD|nr:MAG TPA: hypothetical protein [Siphoviridae sp. ctgmM3]
MGQNSVVEKSQTTERLLLSSFKRVNIKLSLMEYSKN